ncbi:hypothetical protein [Natronobiforma cellulositropha]|uniref:hypothetical protein n=1 Tax=Natronobiforma cellulositropha TaxID=1679076 RepID=UPI0021D5D722|nr:hypothetical protein [Natronobiforma cellulositropha]
MQRPVIGRQSAERTPSEPERTATAGRSSRLSFGRLALVLAVAAVVYALSRRADVQSIDEARTRASEYADGARAAALTDRLEDTPLERVADRLGLRERLSSETPADEGSDIDVLGPERSPDELESLGESNIQETPARPGELTVEDDVVDDLLDDDGDESST